MTATKINKGNYSYRGFNIKLIDNSGYVERGEKSAYKYWTVENLTDESPAEGLRTKKEAMEMVDEYLDTNNLDYLGNYK